MDKVLCDTDIMSALAKADALDVLNLIFPSSDFIITEYVWDELDRSKQEGFDFPDHIFEFCEITTMKEGELKRYESTRFLQISKTDLKNLIIAKNRDMPLLTNDSNLYAEAVKRDVKVYDLRQILIALYEEELLPKKKIRDIVQRIEKKDNTNIKDIEMIFD